MSDIFGATLPMDPRAVSRRSGVSLCMARALAAAQGFRLFDDDFLFDAPTVNPTHQEPRDVPKAIPSATPGSGS